MFFTHEHSGFYLVISNRSTVPTHILQTSIDILCFVISICFQQKLSIYLRPFTFLFSTMSVRHSQIHIAFSPPKVYTLNRFYLKFYKCKIDSILISEKIYFTKYLIDFGQFHFAPDEICKNKLWWWWLNTDVIQRQTLSIEMPREKVECLY